MSETAPSRIKNWLQAILPHVLALLAFFVAYPFWDQYTHYNTSFVQPFFYDMHALHNLMPYAQWSLRGEIGLLLQNPGFVSGVIVGVAQVRRLQDLWKGLIPASILLTASILMILYWRAFHWIPLFLIPAFLGSTSGWGMWLVFSKMRKQTARGIA